MPKLPDQFSLGDVSLHTKYAIPNASDVDAGVVGRGMQSLGTGIENVGTAIGKEDDTEKKQKDALELLRADAIHKEGLSNLGREFDQDSDYETQEPRFRQRANELTGIAGGVISNPQARAQWSVRAGMADSDAATNIGKKTDVMVKQQRMSELDDIMKKGADEFLRPDADDAARSKALMDLNHYIDVAKDSRILNPKEAETYRKKWIDNMLMGTADVPYLRQRIMSGQKQLSPGVTEIEGAPTQEKPLQGRLVPTPGKSGAVQEAKPPQQQAQSQAAPIADLSEHDRDDLIRTVVAESGSQSEKGQAAVAWVALNRLKLGVGGQNMSDVVRAPYQFEGVNNGNADRVRENSPEYKRAAQIVDDVLAGKINDPTSGATNFYAPKAQMELGRRVPNWANANSRTAIIGDHEFFLLPEFRQRMAQAQLDNQSTDASIAAPENRPTPENKPAPALQPIEQGQGEAGNVQFPPWLDNLSAADKARWLERARQVTKKDDAELIARAKQNVNDDITRIKNGDQPAVGSDGRTSLDVARTIMGAKGAAKDFVDLEYNWNKAKLGHALMSPLDNMREDDARTHIDRTLAQADRAGFHYEAIHDLRVEAQKKLGEIADLREKDSVKSVDNSPEVQRARNAIVTRQFDGSFVPTPGLTDYDRRKLLLEARLAAQENVGITPSRQHIVTQDEADRLLDMGAHPDRLPMREFRDKLDTAINKAQSLYGPYARHALEDALGYAILNTNERNLKTQALAKVAMGEPMSNQDMRALADAHKIDPLVTAANALRSRVDTTVAPSVAVSGDFPKPNQDQIDMLHQRPDMWHVFDRQFGAGAAAKALGFKQGANQVPSAPQTPTAWQRLTGNVPLPESMSDAQQRMISQGQTQKNATASPLPSAMSQ